MVRIAPDALDGLKAFAAAQGVPVWQAMSEAARLLVRQTKTAPRLTQRPKT